MELAGHRDPTDEERAVWGEDIKVFVFTGTVAGQQMAVRVPVKSAVVSDDISLEDFMEIQEAAEKVSEQFRRAHELPWHPSTPQLSYDPDKFREKQAQLRAEAAELGIVVKPNSAAVQELRRRRYHNKPWWKHMGDSDIALEEMPELSVRLRNALVRSGVDRRAVVAAMSDEELLSINNVGLSGLIEIRRTVPFSARAYAERHGTINEVEYADMLATWLERQGVAPAGQ